MTHDNDSALDWIMLAVIGCKKNHTNSTDLVTKSIKCRCCLWFVGGFQKVHPTPVVCSLTIRPPGCPNYFFFKSHSLVPTNFIVHCQITFLKKWLFSLQPRQIRIKSFILKPFVGEQIFFWPIEWNLCASDLSFWRQHLAAIRQITA